MKFRPFGFFPKGVNIPKERTRYNLSNLNPLTPTLPEGGGVRRASYFVLVPKLPHYA